MLETRQIPLTFCPKNVVLHSVISLCLPFDMFQNMFVLIIHKVFYTKYISNFKQYRHHLLKTSCLAQKTDGLCHVLRMFGAAQTVGGTAVLGKLLKAHFEI